MQYRSVEKLCDVTSTKLKTTNRRRLKRSLNQEAHTRCKVELVHVYVPMLSCPKKVYVRILQHHTSGNVYRLAKTVTKTQSFPRVCFLSFEFNVMSSMMTGTSTTILRCSYIWRKLLRSCVFSHRFRLFSLAPPTIRTPMMHAPARPPSSRR